MCTYIQYHCILREARGSIRWKARPLPVATPSGLQLAEVEYLKQFGISPYLDDCIWAFASKANFITLLVNTAHKILSNKLRDAVMFTVSEAIAFATIPQRYPGQLPLRTSVPASGWAWGA